MQGAAIVLPGMKHYNYRALHNHPCNYRSSTPTHIAVQKTWRVEPPGTGWLRSRLTEMEYGWLKTRGRYIIILCMGGKSSFRLNVSLVLACMNNTGCTWWLWICRRCVHAWWWRLCIVDTSMVTAMRACLAMVHRWCLHGQHRSKVSPIVQ